MACRIVRLSDSRWHRISSNRCCFSTSSGECLRVAVVGGGAAGLSSALHLAPLVEKGLIACPIDVYEPNSQQQGREIGVGIWSTALDPFRLSERSSHQIAYKDMTHAGHYVQDVGYRTPNGDWLARSQLPTEISQDMELPALLFLREMDMLASLRKAVHLEELQGTVAVHYGDSSLITGIDESSPHAFSAGLIGGKKSKTDRDYHLIVAADGMNSTLRKRYGGHRSMVRLIGATGLQSPSEQKSALTKASSWEDVGQAQANAIEDRNYTVFRGNANMSWSETGLQGVSFQTWGVGKSMRFATVPLSFPRDGTRVEKEVWFITTSDDSIAAEADATRRRELLLYAFANWHPPICRMLEATPPEEILFERAMAHKHCAGPVLNVNRDLTQYQKTERLNSPGPGPAIVFVGDSFMTVDPILAQGFTMAMEGAFQLSNSVEQGCTRISGTESSLAFDPYELRSMLLERFDRRSHRLVCLLRATELVQALGQPSSGVVGSLGMHFVRPLMKVSPNFIKTPVFNAMLRYSLGLPPR